MLKALVTFVALGIAAPVFAQPVVTVTEYNEGKVRRWPISFYDEDTVLVVPFSATYSVVTFAGNILTAETAISPLASSVTVVTPGYTIPAGELQSGNANLPAQIPVAFVVEYCWDGGAQCSADYMWFSLNNVPNYPFP